MNNYKLFMNICIVKSNSKDMAIELWALCKPKTAKLYFIFKLKKISKDWNITKTIYELDKPSETVEELRPMIKEKIKEHIKDSNEYTEALRKINELINLYVSGKRIEHIQQMADFKCKRDTLQVIKCGA